MNIVGIPRPLVLRLGWIGAAFAAMQVLRLVNNVILARLLSPYIFGVVMIAYTIRTGVELLADAGINQNIVSNKSGEDPDFYNTAWTLQIIRGIILSAFTILVAETFADYFSEPQLAIVLPVMALLFVFSGFQSTSRALLQKRVQVVRADVFEISVLLFTVIAQITLAVITPTVWSLVIAGVLSGAATLAASYMLIPGMRHRFVIHRIYAWEILHFSKWIFLATALFFFASNFDRLYFAKQIDIEVLGVFAVARALADMIVSGGARVSSLLLFPTVAAMQGSAQTVRPRLIRGRRTLLVLVALGLGCLIAGSDLLVRTLYDDRYIAAAVILPALLVGVWFAILATVNDSILLGMARPAYPAYGNGAKLLTYIIGVPIAFHHFGFLAAVVVVSAGEVVRYVALWWFTRGQHLAFGRDDLALTTLFALTILAARQAFYSAGWVGDLYELFPALQLGFWGL